MDTFVFIALVTATVLGFGAAYGGLTAIYLALEWSNRKFQQWNCAQSMLVIIQGIFILCVLAIALYFGMQTVKWLSAFEGDCHGYAARSYLVSEVIGLYFVSRSAAYRKFLSK